MPTCFVVMGFNTKPDPNTGKERRHSETNVHLETKMHDERDDRHRDERPDGTGRFGREPRTKTEGQEVNWLPQNPGVSTPLHEALSFSMK